MSNNNNFSAQADQFGKEMSGKMQNAAGEFKEQSQAAKEQGHTRVILDNAAKPVEQQG